MHVQLNVQFVNVATHLILQSEGMEQATYTTLGEFTLHSVRSAHIPHQCVQCFRMTLARCINKVTVIESSTDPSPASRERWTSDQVHHPNKVISELNILHLNYYFSNASLLKLCLHVSLFKWCSIQEFLQATNRCMTQITHHDSIRAFLQATKRCITHFKHGNSLLTTRTWFCVPNIGNTVPIIQKRNRHWIPDFLFWSVLFSAILITMPWHIAELIGCSRVVCKQTEVAWSDRA